MILRPHLFPFAAFACLAAPVASAEVLFEADFQGSTAVTGAVTDNASPAILNGGTATGAWLLSGTGGGNPGAILANAGRSERAFVFDSAISGSVDDLITGTLARAVNLSGGEGLTLDFKLYASRQGTGRQVRIALQDSGGANAYTLVFGLDNSKTLGWLSTTATHTVLATTTSANTGFTNPAVDNYLSWTSGTMVRARVEVLGHSTAAGSSGAKLSVDWNGDGDFTDAEEVSQVAFGPHTAGIGMLGRIQFSYGGSAGNRGIYLDDITVAAVPASAPATYVWTGSASGGDGVSLYQEANWTLDGNNTTLIPQINPTTPVNQLLVVHTGNPGGGGATGTLDLGTGSLAIDGGTVRMNATSGIRGGMLDQRGGTIEALFLESTTTTLAGGTLTLFDPGDALRAGALVNFTAASTATLAFTAESPSAVLAEHLPQITVNGSPARMGVNLSVATDGGSGSLVTLFSGVADSDDDGMNDAWEILHFNTLDRDGTGDYDNDGSPDLEEYQNNTLPDNPDTDGDTLSDGAETNNGVWVSLSATGTDPLKPDSDGDGTPDHIEINQRTDPTDPDSKVNRPNIIFVLCDDLGHGDLGAFFQNQRAAAADPAKPWHFTPRLDTIAAEGIQLRGHYCPAPVCAPSRASLLLGVHQGHSNVRNNQFDKALDNNHTLASMLRSAGYGTYCVGKWGLQGDASFPAHPMKRGFDGYFGYIGHGAGHAHYPKEDDKALYDGYTEVGAQFDKCYTTDLFTARAKKFLTDHHGATPDKPFFLYLAYDTPHAKTQLPSTAFPAGAGLTGGLQWNGTPGSMINTATGTVDGWYHPSYASATWDDPGVAGAVNPWPDVYRRYATMVRRIDDCMHDLVQTLKDLGIDDNTLVVFTSDNGPSKESYLSGTDSNGYSRAYAPTFFASYGPFDGIKRDLWEGGIRVGAIARWPGAIPPDQISHSPSQFHDWMPTFAAMAKTHTPAHSDGVSLLPTLTGIGTQREPTIYVEYFEGGNTPAYTDFLPSRRNRSRDEMQMIRCGNMVGVRYGISSHSNNFEIYDILADPGQTTNLAAANPALQQHMKNRVLQLRRPEGSAARPYDPEPVPPSPPSGPVIHGLRFRAWNQLATTVPEIPDLPPVVRADVPTNTLSLLPRATHCNAAYDGWLQVPADGTWTFALATDSRAHIRLHDAALLDADAGYVSGQSISTTIPLKAGLHPIRIRYSRTTGAAPALALSWSGPSVALQTVPASAFFSDDGDDDGDTLSKSAEAAQGTSDYLVDTDADGLGDATDFDPVTPNVAPGIPELSNASFPENIANPEIGELTADNEALDSLTWSFAPGDGDADNPLFAFAGNRLSLSGSADFETRSSYSIRVRATDLGGLLSEETFVLNVINDAIGRSAAEWHQNEFGAAPVDWSADDDHDGLGRLLEYALGGDPAGDSSAAMPRITISGGVIHYSYTRRAPGYHDLIYQVEASAGLAAWSPAATSVVSITDGPQPWLEHVVLALPPDSVPPLFLRLNVSQLP
jgi:arylsulfatase A-like enzyme